MAPEHRSPPGGRATREFVSEAEEILERLRTGLADLADFVAAPEHTDPELVNALFRAAHSLKGSAGMFQLDGLSELAHHLEEVLDGLRLGRVPLSAPALDLLEEAVESAAGLLRSLQEPEAGAAPALDDLLARIRGLTRPAEPSPETELSEMALDPGLLRALTEYEEHRLRENLRRGRFIHLVEASFEILSFERGLGELTALVRELGELISTLPAPGDASDAQIRFSLLVASELPEDELATRLRASNASVRAVSTPRTRPAGTPEPPRPAAAVSRPDPEATSAPRAARSEAESLRSISETVRVDIHKLDELMNLVGELAIQRNTLAQIAARLAAEPAQAPLARELTKLHRALERKLGELQAGVLEARMVPLGQVFDKLARVVRRLRREQQKAVRLELRGADTELDKLLVEELVDPLLHVVRNAFDHAIEPAEERLAAGKPAEGTIRVEAFQRGNHVVIEVSDDGRGIDVARVHQRAVELGLLPRDAPQSPAEVLPLIFAPGLSTSQQVTHTSGRGVGMDVVRANLSALGGIVDVASEAGRGTRVSFTLPITLAIIQALIVRVADQRFALPLTSVFETLPLDPDAIQRSRDRELLNLRGTPLTLVRLQERLELPGAVPGAGAYAVVLGFGEARVGLVVDALEGQQDAVIKPIQGPLASVRGIAGATELGDQEAVLVLDVAALVEDTLKPREVGA